MATTALDKFRREVKRIQKKTGKSFRAAQKQASKEHKAGKVSGRKKRPAAKKSRKRGRTIGAMQPKGVGDAVSQARKKVHEQLGWMLATQRTAPTKAAKRKLQPKIAELTRKLKALQ